MASGDGFDELRRTAYGRDSSPEERAAASRALRELENSHAIVTPPPPAPLATPNDPDPSAAQRLQVEPAASTTPPPVARLHALWLIPIIAGSLALGALGATFWGAPGPLPMAGGTPEAEATVPVVTSDTSQQVGDLEAAERFFATPQTEQDVYPHAELLPQLQLSTVRFLSGDPTLGRAWVGKDTEGKICLLVDQGGAGAASCSRLSDFVSQGITLGFNEFSASWNGQDWASTSRDGYRQGRTGP
jgi:hypothetical protein